MNHLFTEWWKRTEERVIDLDRRLVGITPQGVDNVAELCDNWKSLTRRVGSYVSRVSNEWNLRPASSSDL